MHILTGQWQRPELLLTVSRLLYHMSNIFWDNAPAPPAQPRLHIDRKRMQELQELRIALGHQPDDHEEDQTQTQTWGGMTMKGGKRKSCAAVNNNRAPPLELRK